MGKKNPNKSPIPISISGKLPILQQKEDIKPYVKVEFIAPKSCEPAGQALFHVSVPQIIIAANYLIEEHHNLGSNGESADAPSVSVEFTGVGMFEPFAEIVNCTADMILVAATWLQAHYFWLLINDIVTKSQQQQQRQGPQLVVPRVM